MNKIIVLSLSIGLLLFVNCSQEGSAQQTEEQLVKTVNVETKELATTEFESFLRLVGNVEAASDVRLSAEASGRILRYYVDKGEEIQQGDLIAKIDDARLQQEKDRLQSLVEQSREQFERQRRIWQEDSVGSEIEFLNAKYRYQQNQASLEAINVQINNTEIRAPFNAVLEDKLTEEGEMATPGVPLVRLIASDQVKINAGVPARYSEAVTVGDSVRIWFNIEGRDTVRTTINFVGNAINNRTRTFDIEMTLPIADRHYKTGMIANILLRTVHRPNAIVVGEEFVYTAGDRNVVYVVGENANDDPIALRKFIQLGPVYKSDVVVTEGLQPGLRLITVGSAFLQDSTRITIVDGQSGALATADAAE